MNSEWLIIGSALLVFAGSLSYLCDTLAGKVRPNRTSWLLWSVAPLIAFSAEINHGVGLSALMTFIVGFGPLVVFVGSFFNRDAAWSFSKLDIFCGSFSVVGVVLWQVTGSGILAILLSIAADTLASVPTLVKAYSRPESESALVYFIWSISAATTLLTLDVWQPAAFAFPLYIFVLGIVLTLLITLRSRTKIRGDFDPSIA